MVGVGMVLLPYSDWETSCPEVFWAECLLNIQLQTDFTTVTRWSTLMAKGLRRQPWTASTLIQLWLGTFVAYHSPSHLSPLFLFSFLGPLKKIIVSIAGHNYCTDHWQYVLHIIDNSLNWLSSFTASGFESVLIQFTI